MFQLRLVRERRSFDTSPLIPLPVRGGEEMADKSFPRVFAIASPSYQKNWNFLTGYLLSGHSDRHDE